MPLLSLMVTMMMAMLVKSHLDINDDEDDNVDATATVTPVTADDGDDDHGNVDKPC
jgi:hypothetical protein